MHSDKDGRQQCYECFGLDGQRVDRYYHVVTDMENAFNVSDDEPAVKEEESPAAAALGFFRLFASMTVAFMGFVLALSAGMLAGLFALQTRDRQRELVHK
jgi:ABC-type dipeptide/oligopeptide/nickel transport system permease component